jgi:hypothetical protein
VVDEISNNNNFLEWVEKRFLVIEELIEELHDGRCEASLLFVDRIREHYESLNAIEMLRQSLEDWATAGLPTTMVQVKKLSSF